MGEPALKQNETEQLPPKTEPSFKAKLTALLILLGLALVGIVGVSIHDAKDLREGLNNSAGLSLILVLFTVFAFAFLYSLKFGGVLLGRLFNLSLVQTFVVKPINFLIDTLLEKPLELFFSLCGKLITRLTPAIKRFSKIAFWCGVIGVGATLVITAFNGLSSLPVNTVLLIVIIFLLMSSRKS